MINHKHSLADYIFNHFLYISMSKINNSKTVDAQTQAEWNRIADMSYSQLAEYDTASYEMQHGFDSMEEDY